jgi:Transglutaminase-like superfamily
MLRTSNRSKLLLLIRTAAWVLAVRIGLWCFSFRNVEALVARLSRNNGKGTNLSAEGLSRSVKRVSRYIPRATCLTQALALHILLKRTGLDSKIQIGVSKEQGKFESHAWVESQEEVLIGEYQLERFTPILTLD